MLPGMELMGCTGLAVPPTVMEHVVKVESSFNPYAIGVVGGRLARRRQRRDFRGFEAHAGEELQHLLELTREPLASRSLLELGAPYTNGQH